MKETLKNVHCELYILIITIQWYLPLLYQSNLVILSLYSLSYFLVTVIVNNTLLFKPKSLF